MTIQTPRRKSRREQSAEVDARLLDAAFDVFCAKGYQAGTLDEVAAAAGVTTGAVYSRYSGKAELVCALVERTIERRIVDLEHQLAAGEFELGTEADLKWLRRARGYSTRPGWGLLALEFRVLAARDPQLRDRFTAVHDRYVSAIADLIEAAITALGRPVADQPMDLARVLAALNTGLVADEVTRSDGPADELATRAMELLRLGMVSAGPPA